MAINIQENINKINKEKDQGHIVLSDRYMDSNRAYSNTEGKDFMTTIDKLHADTPIPDLCFYIKTDLSETKKRTGFGSEIFENIAKQLSVNTFYNSIKRDNWHIIDGNCDTDTITNSILHIFYMKCSSFQLRKV